MNARPQPAVSIWSTRGVPAGQRLSFYSDMMSSAVDPMAAARSPNAAFAAEITATALGPLTLLHAAGSAHDCVRGIEHVALSTERKFHFILNRGPGWNVRHRDPVRLSRGDAVLLDSRLGHYLEFSQPFDIVHLILPEDWLGQWLPDRAALTGLRIPCDANWGRALTAFVAQLDPARIHDAPLSTGLIVDHIGALLALYTDEVSSRQRPPVLQQRQLRDQIQESIVQQCTEFSLSAGEVAHSLAISVRTLHRTLGACGQTFGGLLMTARTALATRMLESPLMARLTIAEIGRRCGFSDPSHFTRMLRTHTGMTPAQMRCGRTRQPPSVE